MLLSLRSRGVWPYELPRAHAARSHNNNGAQMSRFVIIEFRRSSRRALYSLYVILLLLLLHAYDKLKRFVVARSRIVRVFHRNGRRRDSFVYASASYTQDYTHFDNHDLYTATFLKLWVREQFFQLYRF